jgi:trehalose 2-sulfotransferase
VRVSEPRNLLRGAFPENELLRAETLQRAAADSTLYVIFIIPRSGSTWLTELMMNAGHLGVPQEWFNDGWIYSSETALGCRPPKLRRTFDINRYVEEIVAEGRGVAGLELSVFQARMLCELMEQPVDLNCFKAFFYLRRLDIVAQAVSMHRSVSSGVFHSYQQSAEAEARLRGLEYSYDELLRWLHFLLDCESRMQVLFSDLGIRPVPLVYEDLLSDPLGVLQGISRHLGVAPPAEQPMTTLRALRNEQTERWRDRFIEELPQGLREVVDVGSRRRRLGFV